MSNTIDSISSDLHCDDTDNDDPNACGFQQFKLVREVDTTTNIRKLIWSEKGELTRCRPNVIHEFKFELWEDGRWQSSVDIEDQSRHSKWTNTVTTQFFYNDSQHSVIGSSLHHFTGDISSTERKWYHQLGRWQWLLVPPTNPPRPYKFNFDLLDGESPVLMTWAPGIIVASTSAHERVSGSPSDVLRGLIVLVQSRTIFPCSVPACASASGTTAHLVVSTTTSLLATASVTVSACAPISVAIASSLARSRENVTET